MKDFSKYPLVFLGVSIAFGIALGSFLDLLSYLILPLVLSYFVFPIRKIHNYLSVFLVFCVGVYLGQGLLRNQKEEKIEFLNEEVFCQAQIEEVKSWGEQMRILALVENCSEKYLENKKVYLTVSQNDTYQIGEVILFQTKLKPFRKPSIPEQFDFERYYKNRGVVAQSFIDVASIVKLRHEKNWLFRIQQVRNHLESNLDNLLPENDERAIIKALVVGNRSDLDPEIKAQYVSAGIFHVLAVSGLHVGVIYFILLFFIKRIKNKVFQITLLIGGLTFYACLTGLSQSVIRAAIMFAFFGLAQILNRKTSSINVLFGSVFLILFFQPVYLYESGFQLSVSAVLGILLFFRSVESWVQTKYKWLNYIWSLAAVSIAAQTLTTPLILYYFHQFPSYFIFINVLVVFLVQFVLIAGTIAAALGDFFGVGYFFAKIAESICWCINKASYYTSTFPFSRITGIHFSEIQVAVLLGAILAFYWYFNSKRRAFFYFSFVLFACTSLLISKRFFEYENQSYLALHKVKNQLVIEKVRGKSTQIYFDNANLTPKEIDVAMSNYWSKRNISIQEFKELNLPIMLNGKALLESKYKISNPEVWTYKQTKWSFIVFEKDEEMFSSENGMSLFLASNDLQP